MSLTRAGNTLSLNIQLKVTLLKLSLTRDFRRNETASKACVNPYTDCIDGVQLSELNSHFYCCCTYSAIVIISNEVA